MKKLLSLSLLASSLLLADTELEELKKLMNKQQSMMEKLQEKIMKLEEKANNKPSLEKELKDEPKFAEAIDLKSTPNNNGAFNQSKFIPDMSLILDTSFVSRNQRDSQVAHLEVPGIAHGILGSHSHDGSSHSTYNANRGFNFNYAELALSSSIDPYFNMDAVFHFSEDSVEVEEAYFTSTAIDYGLRLKGGKFLSNFGYINEKHHHAWSFSDMPLVYESFLGTHGINEIGLQLQWTAPTDTYLMFGAEILQGTNEQMFGNDAIGEEDDMIVDDATAPSLFVTYAKSSVDVDNTTILGGLSYAKGKSRLDHTSDEEPHAFSGDSSLYGADLLIKHYLDSYSSVSLQTEWLMRDMNGILYKESVADSGDFDVRKNLRKKQAGLYTQLIYNINQTWAIGARYDNIYQNDVYEDNTNQDEPDNLDKYSAMVEYKTSEFARFRLQYNRNNALYSEAEDGESPHRQKIDTLILQANIAIGAHGAHSF